MHKNVSNDTIKVWSGLPYRAKTIYVDSHLICIILVPMIYLGFNNIFLLKTLDFICAFVFNPTIQKVLQVEYSLSKDLKLNSPNWILSVWCWYPKVLSLESWGEGTTVKRMRCSCRVLALFPRTYTGVVTPVQGIQLPLLDSKKHLHTLNTHTHTQAHIYK